ncbi:SusD/RagB family nutrient-binding outer membrane lipoprotein [Aquimarina latercula]|uniref:SusD/RagB family nutrient-binding outer membrane lipoprotein n=1 Tax=Aquimarina latercula TaxID=987 RepID=UPI000408C95A|nr:SusD/RagB family nutrient-binding outer membrane lipoprotein [Aquimarina latercula]
MKKIFKYFSLFVIISIITSCETTELDLTVNPNQVGQEDVDPDFLFNNVQLSFYNFVEQAAGFTSFASDLTRMHAATGGAIYSEAYSPLGFDAVWEAAYADVLKDISSLEPLAADINLTYHQGVSKVIKAYTIVTLVDLFGDVPFSEALQGNDNLNPNADDQAQIYIDALNELDLAIALLNTEPSSFPPLDLFYGLGGDGTDATTQAKWVTAANTLKLKIYLTARLNGTAINTDIASEINTLIAEGNLIDAADEDWQLNYGGNRQNPDNRHPAYATFYENDPGGQYVSNYYMWTMLFEKPLEDPRTPFYFFRQDLDATNEDNFTLQCATAATPPHYFGVTSQYDGNNTVVPFCVTDINRGYWGRDHLDNAGLPPDSNKRTVMGLYPAGGKFDDGSGGSVQNEGADGSGGAGITPILTSSFVNFMLAEAALTLGTTGDAQVYLTQGIADSFSKVSNFAGSAESVGNLALYQSFVDQEYLASMDDEQRLEIVAKEYYLALFGNGIEAYNMYRRTGYPANLQPSLSPTPGDFYRSALYPSDYVNANTNASQRQRTEQIFWDTNPAGFIN